MFRRSSSGDAPRSAGAAAGSTDDGMPSVALARDHVGLVEEPEALVTTKHLLRGLEISAVSDDLAQALILDLRHVNGGVPRGEKGRGADRVADFLRERVHLVAEYRAVVGVGVEVEVAAICSERGAGRLQECVAIGLERIFSRPDALHDLEPRVAAVGMDRDHSPARRKTPRERCQDLGRLELGRGASTVWLRGYDQVVVGAGGAAARQHLVEKELVVFP